jgi:hypothetical protein
MTLSASTRAAFAAHENRCVFRPPAARASEPTGRL